MILDLGLRNDWRFGIADLGIELSDLEIFDEEIQSPNPKSDLSNHSSIPNLKSSIQRVWR
jgi:hypothetical protein